METVVVRRWMRNGRQITYEFGKSKNIPVTIFQDDTISSALAKIALGIAEYHKQREEAELKPSLDVLPYAWFKKRQLRFDIGNHKLPINPWNLPLNDIPKIDDASLSVRYKDSELLNVTTVNIVFASDLPKQLENYIGYFPDVASKWKPPKLETLQKESQLLDDVWSLSSNKTIDFIVTKVRFISHLKHVLNLPTLFETIKTSQTVPFIQLVEDTYKIMYKVHGRHKIPLTIMQSWTIFERIPKVPSIIVMFPMQRERQWARLCIEQTGNIILTYQVESRDNLRWNDCIAHSEKIKSWLERAFKTNILFNVDDVTIKTEFVVESMSLQTVSKMFGAMQPVFHVLKMQDGALEIVCKRSQNYRQKLDILDFIQSRIKLGSSLIDILDDLKSLGLSADDIDFWKTQYLMSEDAKIQGTNDGTKQESIGRKKTLNQTGCMIQVSKSPTGFRAYIIHAASLEELQRIRRWIEGVLLKTSMMMKEKDTNKAPSPKQTKVEPQKNGDMDKQDTPDDEQIETLLDDEDLDDFFGGALGKDFQRYFNKELISADPEIFLDKPLDPKKMYSRQCAANNFRQPVVLTVAEKEAIDKTDYKNSYDDAVLYGSDPNKQHYYMCPRIWCSKARIPLTEEQLKKNDGYCPGPHKEKPMLLYEDKYWDNSAKTPKYIGFMKERSPKGFCLPCCGKKVMKPAMAQQCSAPGQPQNVATKQTKKPKNKKDESSKITKPESSISSATSSLTNAPGPSAVTAATAATATRGYKEDTYIMGAPAPLPTDRFGAIPKDLHQLLLPQVAYNTCSNKSINSTACFVRRGIGIDDDNMMKTLSLALGLQSKSELIKYIKERLDPLTYISLENGHILKAFAPDNAIEPSKNKGLTNQWSAWMKRWPQYHNMINRNYDISRELGIFVSYQNFIQHLASNDPKNPQHLIDFFMRQGILIVLWKRDGPQSATTLCPYFTDVKNVLHDGVKNVIMLLQDGQYLEHIEWKARGSKPRALHPITELKSVTDILDKCPIINDDYRLSHKLAVINGIDNWIHIMLKDPSRFDTQTIILRQDLSIYGAITKCGVIILYPPRFGIGIISDVLRLGSIQHKYIAYHEDIQGNTYNVENVFINDLALVATKLQSLGFGIFVGKIEKRNESLLIKSHVQIPIADVTISPAIYSFNENAASIWNNKANKRNAKWSQLSKMIGSTISTYYETLVTPLLQKDRSHMIHTLMNTFPTIPDKHIVQSILEEMPLSDGKDAIENWIRAQNLEERTRQYMKDDVRFEKNEWLFTQSSIESGMPWHLLASSNGPKASIYHTPNNAIILDNHNQNDDNIATPKMLLNTNVEIKDLPSKFSKIRQYDWNRYKIWKQTDYSIDNVKELIEWMSKKVEFPLSWEEIQGAYVQLISNLLTKKEWITPFLDDPSFVAAWKDVLPKKRGMKANDLWESGLGKLSVADRGDLWLNTVSKSKILMPSDAHWYIVSQILGIHILIIHRTKYGKAADNVFQRADLEDQSMSSFFHVARSSTIKQWYDMPCVMMFKENESSRLSYHPIVNDKNEFMHATVNELHTDVKELMKYHIEHRK